ncbi:MAG: hypothetical protein H6Q09_1703 [Acidobacteria bacterium]|nr:hypothetical protein [Acidobacteriota bacterium]
MRASPGAAQQGARLACGSRPRHVRRHTCPRPGAPGSDFSPRGSEGVSEAHLHRQPRGIRDQDRRRARRRGLEGGCRRPAALRVGPRRQRAAAGRDPMPDHLRREEPLRGLPGARSEARRHPRAPDGSRRHRHAHPGRPRRRDDRHVQRRAPRVPVPRQPSRRASRRDLQRAGRRRGLLMGHDLERRQPHHGRRLHRRGGVSAEAAALPARHRAADLGLRGVSLVAPERAAPHFVAGARPQQGMPALPGEQDHGARGPRPGAQRRVGPDGHVQPHG